MKSIVCIITIKSTESITSMKELVNSNIVNLGTGFIINGNGLIITAGHVVEKDNNERIYCIYEDNIYPVKIIYSNYPKFGLHKDFIKDFAICEINTETKECFYLPKKNESSNVGMPLTISGYASIKSNESFSDKIDFNKYSIIKLSGIYYSSHCEEPKFDKYGVTYGGLYSNAFKVTLNLDLEISSLKGISGSPIISENQRILGVFVKGVVYRNIIIGTGIEIDYDILNSNLRYEY